MKVLIIEDSPEIVESVTLCFKMFIPEAAVSFSYNGLQGIKFAESEPFDIVILDLNLPEIDGLEVLERIRSFSNVPVLILTVREKIEDKLKGLSLGADDYMVKPFKPRELISRVTSAISRKNQPQEKKLL
jgi:DNA-binding response OmpR family regulator